MTCIVKMNTSAAASYLYGSSFASNARPRNLTLWQTDSFATVPGSASSTKIGNDQFPGAMVFSKYKDSGHTVAANEAAESAYQRSLHDSATQGLLQLGADSVAYESGRNSIHAMLRTDGRNEGIYNRARSTESPSLPGEDVSAQALLSLLEGRPMFTKEQLEMERAMLTNEEIAEIFSDLFGKKQSAVDRRHRKSAKRDHKTIEFLVQQMRLELEMIPEEEKQALMEAQIKCRENEFSDAHLERFL